MTKLYLITGFLGSGKTTFLHSFTGLFPNQKIALVINEFGAAGVCRMQLAISDFVLINKTDLATREQIDDITAIALAQKPARPEGHPGGHIPVPQLRCYTIAAAPHDIVNTLEKAQIALFHLAEPSTTLLNWRLFYAC